MHIWLTAHLTWTTRTSGCPLSSSHGNWSQWSLCMVSDWPQMLHGQSHCVTSASTGLLSAVSIACYSSAICTFGVTASNAEITSSSSRLTGLTKTNEKWLIINDNLLNYGSRLQARLVQYRHTYNKIQLVDDKALLPSTRQHPGYGDCLEVKREYYQNCSVLDCVTQCSQSAAHLYEQFLQVQQIGFVTLGPLRCA